MGRQSGARGRRHGNPLVYGSMQAKSTDVPHGLDNGPDVACIPARSYRISPGPGKPLFWSFSSPDEDRLYLTSTVAPAASSFSLAASACSLGTCSKTGLGALSTRSLASFRPRLVRARTSLMTWIFLSPAEARTTSNS